MSVIRWFESKAKLAIASFEKSLGSMGFIVLLSPVVGAEAPSVVGAEAPSVAAAATPTTQASAAVEPEFVVRAARVFDGERVLPRADVWVRDGLIAGVGENLRVEPGVTVIDGAGATLLPGLIDAHAHAFGDALRVALAFGVTTELDMFTSAEWARDIKKSQAAGGDADMADLRSAGTLVTAPGGHGTEFGMDIPTLASAADAPAFVDARIAEGSDYIKIVEDDGATYGLHFPTLDRETMTAVIAAAHRRGKLAVVHIGSLAGARDAIGAGCNGLAHLFVDRAPDADFAAFAARHHVFVVPTLSVLSSISGTPGGATLADDPRLRDDLSPAMRTNLRAGFSKPSGRLEYAEETVRQLLAQHVPILAGTDAPNPGTAHGVSMHGELAMLVHAGLTPVQALAAATSAPADAFGLGDRGRIARGQRADLLLVRGDPTHDITATRDIVKVWKAGIELDRAAFRSEIATKRADAEAQKAAPAPSGSDSGWISDFDDGTTAVRFGVGWQVSTDSYRGGTSTAEMHVVDAGAGGRGKALHVNGAIVAGPATWAGAMFFPGATPMGPANLSQHKSISFLAKGDGHSYAVMLFSRSNGFIPKSRPFVAAGEWTRVELPLTEFDTDGHDLMGLFFGASSSAGPFDFTIDDVRLE